MSSDLSDILPRSTSSPRCMTWPPNYTLLPRLGLPVRCLSAQAWMMWKTCNLNINLTGFHRSIHGHIKDIEARDKEHQSMINEVQDRMSLLYANPNFVGDQVSIELQEYRGENDMELKRRMTRQEHKSYGNIRNLIPVTPKAGIKSIGGGVDTAKVPGTHSSLIDHTPFSKPGTQICPIDLTTLHNPSSANFPSSTQTSFPLTLHNPVGTLSCIAPYRIGGSSGTLQAAVRKYQSRVG